MKFATMMKISLMAIGLALLPVAAPLQGVPEAAAQQGEADREAEKEAKRAEKEAKKAAREAEKEAKKAEQEAKKAARDAEKEAKKAEQEAKRAAKKAEQEARKAARKEAEEAKKAAKREAEEAKKAAKEAKKEAEAAKKAAKEAEQEAKKAAKELEEAREEAGKAEEEVRKTTPKARSEARKLSELGLKHVSKGEYDLAIECFGTAYELHPLPDHLFNLAWVYKRKGDKRKSHEVFQKFLAANPRDRSMVTEATEYLDELKRYIDQEDALLAENKALKQEGEQTKQEMARLGKAHEDMRKAMDELENAPAQAPVHATLAASGTGAGGGKRTAGVAMLAAGGVALGAAIFSGAEARSADRKLDRLGPDDTFSESRVWLHERGEAAEKRMIIFSITGAALVAGGAVVYYLGEREARRPSQLERGPVAITPAVSPSGAGIQVSGSF